MAELDQLFSRAREWGEASLAIATVIRTWGSAPRPIGSHMLVHDDGRFEGSVSGGCVENDVIAEARMVARNGGLRRLLFGVEDASAWHAGLPCGGDIEILIQQVGERGFAPGWFGCIAKAREKGEIFRLATDLDTGLTGKAVGPGDFINHYRPRRRLLIVGAVQIAQILCRFAEELDFEVTIIDPRQAYLDRSRFPSGHLNDRWPDDAIRAAKPNSSTAVVTLSHDPKLDDPALLAALASPAGYIAALGSTRSHHARLERLEALGVTGEALDRIEGPAGVPLGGRSVSEIALSIAAGAVRALSEAVPEHRDSSPVAAVHHHVFV